MVHKHWATIVYTVLLSEIPILYGLAKIVLYLPLVPEVSNCTCTLCMYIRDTHTNTHTHTHTHLLTPQVEDRLVCCHSHKQIMEVLTDRKRPTVKAYVVPPAPGGRCGHHSTLYV